MRLNRLRLLKLGSRFHRLLFRRLFVFRFFRRRWSERQPQYLRLLPVKSRRLLLTGGQRRLVQESIVVKVSQKLLLMTDDSLHLFSRNDKLSFCHVGNLISQLNVLLDQFKFVFVQLLLKCWLENWFLLDSIVGVFGEHRRTSRPLVR